MDKDIEDIKKLSETFKGLAKILDEVIALEDNEELTDEEVNKKIEELLGKFLMKYIKANKLLEGLK